MNEHEFDCNIILDLLPLSIDYLVSKETDQIIHEHLANCSSCRQVYQDMGQSMEVFSNIKSSMHRKKHGFRRKTRVKIFVLGYIFFLLMVLAWVLIGLL